MALGHTPRFTVSFTNASNTTDMSMHVTSLTYKDVLSAEASEVSVVFEDGDAEWRGDLFPNKGDTMAVDIWYEEEVEEDEDNVLKCGNFEVEEVRLQGDAKGGDRVDIRGLSVAITERLRTVMHFTANNLQMKEWIEKLAQMGGIDEVDSDVPDIRIKKVTSHQSILRNLQKKADEIGAVVRLEVNKDGKLVLYFKKYEEFINQETYVTINRKGLLSYNIRSKTDDVYREFVASSHDPEAKKVVQSEIKKSPGEVAKADVKKIHKRADSGAEAARLALAQDIKARLEAVTGTVSMIGDPGMCTGKKIELAGFGKLDGPYLVWEATHTITRSGGYVTELTLKSCRTIEEGERS